MKVRRLINLMIALGLILAVKTSGQTNALDETQLNEKWNTLSPREKAVALRFSTALRQMPPEERKFIHDRIERFLEMTPEERHRLKENNERWQKMTPEEKQQAREKYRQRRKEFEEKWRKEHPNEPPPPFLMPSPHKRNLAAPKDGAQPKTTQPTQPKESQP